MSISRLREQLRKAGIPDEDMFFGDGPDDSIIPRLVFHMNGEVAVQKISSRPVPKVEKCDSLCTPDNREQRPVHQARLEEDPC